MDRITGLTAGFRASTGFRTAWGFSDFTWRDFGGCARDGDCLTPCFGGVFLVSGALYFKADGFCFDVCDAGFCATFCLAAGFGAVGGLGAGFDAGSFCAAFGFAAGFFCAALVFAADFGAAWRFTADFGLTAGFGLAAGFFTAFGAAARVLLALDGFGAASAS